MYGKAKKTFFKTLITFIWRLCLPFSKNDFNILTKKFATKKTNNATPNTLKLQNLFLKCLQWQSFNLSSFEGSFFQLRYSKVSKRPKGATLKCSEQSVVTKRFQNHFLLKKSRWQTFDSNTFEGLGLRENFQKKVKVILNA